MDMIKITLTPHSRLKKDEYFCTEQLKKHFPSNTTLKIKVGSLRISLQFTPLEELASASEDTLFVSPDFYNHCSLPQETSAFQLLKKEASTSFELGPIIMVLTESKPPFGTLEIFLQELIELSKTLGGFIYVSGGEEFSEVTNFGYVYQNEKWEYTELPLPHVIYNRIHTRKTEKSPSFQKLFQQLKDLQIPYFNDHYIDKWEMHQLLSSFPALRPYLPPTKSFTSPEDLIYFCTHYEEVFLKPVSGAQGQNIIKISAQGNSYHCRFTTENFMDEDVQDLHELYEKIKRKIKNQPYIIQRGIPLQTYEGKHFDLRILGHQTRKDQWQVTSVVTRLSDEHTFVCNLAKGGQMEKINKVLYSLYDKKEATHLKHLLEEITLEACASLHQILPPLYCEFGMDLAIDLDGKPWILEVNIKPSKSFGEAWRQEKKIRPSTIAIFEACYQFGYLKE